MSPTVTLKTTKSKEKTENQIFPQVISPIANGSLKQNIANPIMVQLPKIIKFSKRKKNDSLDTFISKKIKISNDSLDTSSSKKIRSSKSNSPNLNNNSRKPSDMTMIKKKNDDIELIPNKVKMNSPPSPLKQIKTAFRFTSGSVANTANSSIITNPLQNKFSNRTTMSYYAQNLPRTHNSDFSSGSDNDSDHIYNDVSKSSYNIDKSVNLSRNICFKISKSLNKSSPDDCEEDIDEEQDIGSDEDNFTEDNTKEADINIGLYFYC